MTGHGGRRGVIAAPPVVLLGIAAVAVALAAADTYVVVLALTDMMAGVGIGLDALQRATPILSGFLLGYISVLPLVGRLSDLVDRRRILLWCLVAFAVGSAVTAVAVELPVLVAGRVVQGAGGGGLVPATLALVADLWPPGKRGVPLGMVGAVQEIGSVLGPVLGAAVLAIADWRAIFWLNVVLAIVLALLVAVVRPVGARQTADGPDPDGAQAPAPTTSPTRRWAGAGVGVLALATGLLALAAPAVLATDVTFGIPFVPFVGDSRVLTPVGMAALALAVGWLVLEAPRWLPVLRRADVPGAILLGGALGCVVLTFAAADPAREVVGPLGWVLLPVGLVLAVLYAWRARRVPAPLVPREALQGRARFALAVSALSGVALVAVVVDVPLLARVAIGATQEEAALVLVRFLVAVPLGALAGGWMLRRAGAGTVAGLGLFLAALGLLTMSTWGKDALDAWFATPVLVVVGLGLGLALAPVNDAALADAPADAHGTASALVVVARMVGMVVGLALLTAVGLHQYYEAVGRLADKTDGGALVDAAVVQVRTVFLGAALAAALGGLAAFLRLGVRPPRRTDVPEGIRAA